MANQQPHRRFKRETMSSRWMPGQKLAIVRKSDRLKSEGDFEGDRQLEEWSPADRFSDSTFYSRLVFSVNCFVTQINEFMRKTFQAAQLKCLNPILVRTPFHYHIFLQALSHFVGSSPT